MDTSSEIRSSINNILYYANKVQDLTKLQMEKDAETGLLLGIDTNVGSIRFECIGAIRTAAEWIQVYCENIESNLKTAESLDKELFSNSKEGEENER